MTFLSYGFDELAAEDDFDGDPADHFTMNTQKPVSKMKRSELEREARELGIEKTDLMDLPNLRGWVRAKRRTQ